jgi:RNA polymerase sigma-70 factor (ECF subfamily)
MTDQELAEAWPNMLAGDEAAFEKIYEATKQDAYRTAMFLVNEPNDACDIVSEAYMAMWKNKLSYDVKRPFRFWLHGIVIKRSQMLRRQRWRQFRLFTKQKSLINKMTFEMDMALGNEPLQEELQTLIRQLSFKLRVVIILRYYHDYSLEGIATLLELPLGTVKSRHHAALTKLRSAMSPSWDGKVEKPYAF